MYNFSIYGDSISTFEGYNPEGYAVYYNQLIQQKNQLDSVDDTWWSQVIRAFNGRLCVNNSFSGSRVSGAYFPSGASENRCGGLHTYNLTPDIILICLGDNDFGNGVPIKRKKLPFMKLDSGVFYDAYRIMLKRLKQNYPQTVIICATLVRTVIKDKPGWPFPETFAGVPFDDYNTAIRKACRKEHCFLADLDALNLRYETLDGSHPNKTGHKELANAWITVLDTIIKSMLITTQTTISGNVVYY